MAYLALWKVADADFPIAPNPTPTARPSETGRKKTSKVKPYTSPETVPPALQWSKDWCEQESRTPGQVVLLLVFI